MAPSSNAHDPSPDARSFVSQEFARRAADSERTRLLIFGVIGIVPAFVAMVITRLFPAPVAEIFHGHFDPRVAMLAWTPLALYGFGGRYWVGKLQRDGRSLPTAITYVVSAIEISLPSAIILVLFAVFPPVFALVAPPVLIYPVFIVLTALRLDPRLCLFAGALAAVEYLAVTALALSRPAPPGMEVMMLAPLQHLGKGVLLLLCGVITSIAAKQIRNGIVDSVVRLQEQNRILDVFGKHVSPEVVNRLLAQRAEPVNEERPVCVMFLDIRGFTKFSESKSPEEVVEFLNRLFDFMIDEITERGGIINKFLGDGFMAIFGAPVSTGADCDRAVDASRAILERVHADVASGALPPTRIGIALHYGPVITGQVGSRRRREYTVIGDVVNATSRLEALNKKHGTELLVSGAVLDALKHERPETRSIGPVELRGREEPMQVFAIES